MSNPLLHPDRRQLLMAGGATVGLALPSVRACAAVLADHTIWIAPVSHEIAPGKVIRTTAHSASVMKVA